MMTWTEMNKAQDCVLCQLLMFLEELKGEEQEETKRRLQVLYIMPDSVTSTTVCLSIRTIALIAILNSFVLAE